MGRLSYVNRKIDGLRLGQVVARDLSKRIPPGSGHKAALRDQVLELDVSTKQLKDDGFAEMALALTESIKYNGETGRIVVLEDLSLKDNGLTIASLGKLAPIIRLTCNDLRDLDLSNNSIKVETLDDVLIWEDFLRSFANACVLRRLDLSGNPLGSKAFEILTKVCAREQRLDLPMSDYTRTAEEDFLDDNMTKSKKTSEILHALQQVNLFSNSDQDCNNDDDAEECSSNSYEVKAGRRGSESSRRLESSPNAPDKTPCYSVMKGLHSVPYLVLSNTLMTDPCALFLSYVLEAHHLPGLLLDFVPAARAGPMQQQLIAYDNETQCRGLVYLPNSMLGPVGLKVLDLSEKSRDTLVKTSISHDLSEDTQQDSTTSIANSLRSHTTRANQPATVGTPHRKATAATSPDKSHPSHLTGTLSDLDRARSRIQVDILDTTAAGRLQNDLWRTALSMLSIGRAFQYRKPPPPAPPPVPAPRLPIIKTLEIPGMPPKKPKSILPATEPLGSANPNKTMMPRSGWIEKSNVAPNSRAAPADSPSTPGKLVRKPLDYLRERPYRTDLQYGFSEDTWRKIICHAAGADGMLSKKQQLLVTRWAMDRKTLDQEREWLVLRKGNQIWHILDEIKCLAYEGDI